MKFVEISPSQYISLDSIEQVTFTFEDVPKNPGSQFTDKICTAADVVFRGSNGKPIHLEVEGARKLRAAIQAAR
jgi:hypothetical protein